MIVLSIGMVKAGSAWYFNLTNDLLVAAGHQDARDIRQKFHLQSILIGVACRLDGPLLHQLLILTPHFSGNTFAIKRHGPPSKGLRFLIGAGVSKATYIYRDPRDVVVSAFERGQKDRAAGETGVFAELDTIETAVLYVQQELESWDKWMQYNKALTVRYEDLIADTVHELERLADFLALDVSEEDLRRVAATYRPQNLPSIAQEKGDLHFNKGIIGRFRQVLTPKELALCQKHFGDYLPRMGYEEK